MRFLGFLFRVLLCVAAGLVLGGAFPDASIWLFVVPALACILRVVDSVRVGSAFVYGVIFGASFWFPHVSWAIISAGGGYLPWIALSLSQAVVWGLWAASASAFSRLPWAGHPVGYAVLMAVSWVGVEQLRARVPFSGFPWGNLAYVHVDAPLGHLAPLGGEVLVSFLVVVVASCVRFVWVPRRNLSASGRRWWVKPVVGLVAVGLYVLPGFIPLSVAQQTGSVRIGVIQGGVEVPGGRTYAVEGKVTGNHVRQTQELLASGTQVDLVVWGEGALDRDPRVSGLVRGLVDSSVGRAGVPFLMGFNEYVSDRDVIHNLYGAWYPDSGLDAVVYGKQIPVPFGEYIPFRDFVSSLATEAAQVAVDMEGMDNVGRVDVRLSDGRVLPVGLGICFEVAYEGIWAEGVSAGSEILVSPSNNYHFRDSVEPAQQGQMARFRALEFGRSMVQASTTGESLLIRPDGGIIAKTPRHAGAFASAELPLRTSVTPAVFLAQPLAWCVIASWALCVLVAVIRGFFHRKG